MAKKQRCEIELLRDGRPQALSFNAAIPETLLCDMFMSEFAPLGLATHEKREMSLKDREQLCRFRNLDCNDVQKHATKLLKTISKLKTGTCVHINASDVAAYVCLAAIYSGDMPEHLEICFELSDVPAKLFPEHLVKSRIPDNVVLNLNSPENSWLARFQSVCELPSHMAPTKSQRRIRAAA